MEKLSFSNFFNHYIIYPDSANLSSKDQSRAKAWSIVVGLFTLWIPHFICDFREILSNKRVAKLPTKSKSAKVMHRVHKVNTKKIHTPVPKVLTPKKPDPKASDQPKEKEAPLQSESERQFSFFSQLPETVQFRIFDFSADPRFGFRSSLSANSDYVSDPKFRLISRETGEIWDGNLKIINDRIIRQAGCIVGYNDKGESKEIPWLLYGLPQETASELERFKNIMTLLHSRAKRLEVDLPAAKGLKGNERLRFELQCASALIKRMREKDERVAAEKAALEEDRQMAEALERSMKDPEDEEIEKVKMISLQEANAEEQDYEEILQAVLKKSEKDVETAELVDFEPIDWQPQTMAD